MSQYGVLERVFAYLRHRLQIPDKQRIEAAVAKAQHAGLRELARQSSLEAKDVVRELKKLPQSLHEASATQARALAALAQGLHTVQERLHDTVKRQYKLELAHAADRALIRRIDHRVAAGFVATMTSQTEVDVEESDASTPAPMPPIVHGDSLADDDDWVTLRACPACASTAGVIVCEYNRLLLHGEAPDPDFHVYNYTLCDQCGIVYAARRPRGERFRHLLHNFTESLGRMTPGTNLLLNAKPLSEDDRQELTRRAAQGVFVSEHVGLGRRDYLPSLQRDRLAMAPHIELLGSLLALKGARVVEVRSRTGSLLAALRRLYDADVMAMPIFESQQHVLRQVYDIPAVALIDFEHFALPYDGPFDLVISNHMVTHALHPLAMLQEFRAHMRRGDHLYLYNEPDESECLDLRQSMFKILNPFHMQTFDPASLLRLLARAGFEPVHVCHTDSVYLQCLARAVDPTEPPPLPRDEFMRRVAAYANARDIAILQAPEQTQQLFGAEREAARERALMAGLVDLDERGRLRFVH